MVEIVWSRFPNITLLPSAHSWLKIQLLSGLTQNTVLAYGHDLEDYLSFCRLNQIDPEAVTKEHIGLYVNDLRQRPSPRGKNIILFDSGVGLANATMQRRLTSVRLYYDYLVEEGTRPSNPVGRGRYTPGKGFRGSESRGFLERYQKLPWIPNNEQWLTLVDLFRQESLRNRVMFALAYDGALRREELCSLQTTDIDVANRQIRIRAETTKNRRERIVPYQKATSTLFVAYIHYRRHLSRSSGALFLSESRRNRLEPLSIWTWSKVVHSIAERANLPQFSTHTLRHLCLTDLARAGWDIHEIAAFAGHTNPQTTLRYIHRSGRELATKLERSMRSLHAWRMNTIVEESV